MTRAAILAETKWALGRIYKPLERVLRECGYDVQYFDTYVYSDLDLFKSCFQQFDVVIGHSASVCYLMQKDLNESNAHKFLLTLHSPVLDNSHFSEYVSLLKDITYTAACKAGVKTVRDVRGGYVAWTPFGVDLNIFPMSKTSTTLNTAGFIGNFETSEAHISVKRPGTFAEICARSKLNPKYIYNQPSDLGPLLYKDLDVLICCSTYESGPLGVFEAAALGIPVLTPAVGNSQLIPGLKLFETVGDAVAILQQWRDHPAERLEYASALQKEVRDKWSMDTLLKTYMVPVVQHVVCKQPTILPVSFD